MINSRFGSVTMLALLLLGCASVMPKERVVYSDNFQSGLRNWIVEAEQPSRVVARGGVLDIDAPAGITLWLARELSGPTAIEFNVTAVAARGPNDAVSDVNAFWMATDSRISSGDVLERRRSGAFADYDELRTYYVGIGGNRNTTSRMRRYIGRRGERPLLAEHDLSTRANLLQPNRPYHIRLVADGSRIEVRRDGRLMFRLDDPHPYTHGHFGFRTTKSHLRITNFRVLQLDLRESRASGT
jgi:uncharacterized protein DUF6250